MSEKLRYRPAGRTEGGFCGVTAEIMVARAALHMWEEPCISGKGRFRCGVFPQAVHWDVYFVRTGQSQKGQSGKMITVERLAEIFLDLQRAEGE